ncbi:hypothetical protein PILCRDRAFT_496189 [Piloderma croceum F 1598]|uniref:Uncharacterized protein n=1 Tax=Piloderma croceum (strain F 1598) TaxID=765440 RepID=A0A0C3B5N8_PILCF|nr:hypothetical protein PILCRDRAFT_496189 [Piloderma croceum F 1598]
MAWNDSKVMHHCAWLVSTKLPIISPWFVKIKVVTVSQKRNTSLHPALRLRGGWTSGNCEDLWSDCLGAAALIQDSQSHRQQWLTPVVDLWPAFRYPRSSLCRIISSYRSQFISFTTASYRTRTIIVSDDSGSVVYEKKVREMWFHYKSASRATGESKFQEFILILTFSQAS